MTEMTMAQASMTRALMTRALRAETAFLRLTRASRLLLKRARVLTRRRLRRHDLDRLNAHMRRDIGISRERK